MFALQKPSALVASVEVAAPVASELRQINVKDYIHEQGAGGSCPAWEWESCSIFAFTEECVILAKNDWKHIPLKSSFCFMRCIAAGARSMMLWFLYACRYRRHWIIDSISKTPQEQVQHFRWRQRKRGWDWSEESGNGEEHVQFSREVGVGGGIIDFIGESCWETAWKSAGGRLSVCAATLSINFHLLVADCSTGLVVTQGRRLQTCYRTCVPLCPPGLHP